MVVSNPLSDKEQESIKEALEDALNASSVEVDDANTHDGEYDYEIQFVEHHPKPKIRGGKAFVLWHDDVSDWEVNIEDTGLWRS